MRYAGYLRVSTDKKDQLNSLENQALIIRNHANIANEDIYADPGITGTSLKNRRKLNKLLYKCGIDMEVINGIPSYTLANRNAKYDCIVVKNTSRLARTTDIFQILNLLEKKNVEIFFLDLNKSSLDKDARTLISIMLILDEQYSSDLSKKIKMGLDASVQKQVPLQQNLFGYNKDLTINAEEAEIIKFIYNKYLLDGVGTLAMSKLIEKKYNVKFSKTRVYHVLKNKKYCGYYVRQGLEIANYQPAIISTDLFNAVQEKLKEKNLNKHSRNMDKQLFTGHVFCGYCGTTFRVNYNKRYKKGEVVGVTKFLICTNKKLSTGKCTDEQRTIKYDYLVNKCENYINNEYLQKINIIKQFNLSLLDDMLKTIKATDYTEKINNIQKQLERLLDGYLQGFIEQDIYTKKKSELEIELEKLKMNIDNRNIDRINEVKEEIMAISNKKPKDIKELLKLADIIVYKDNIDFKLKMEVAIQELIKELGR